jgi:hypothetical protein
LAEIEVLTVFPSTFEVSSGGMGATDLKRTGTIYVNRTTGWVVRSMTTFNMRATAESKAGMNLAQNITLKTEQTLAPAN